MFILRTFLHFPSTDTLKESLSSPEKKIESFVPPKNTQKSLVLLLGQS